MSLCDRSSLDGFALHIPRRLDPHRTIRASRSGASLSRAASLQAANRRCGLRASMHAVRRRPRARAVKTAQRLAGGIAK
ncbi:hypothetical protein LC55x_0027 [Lysobacter capsici]|nr:hypothetical protein LC55x_0027 [Lysobacter capsici]